MVYGIRYNFDRSHNKTASITSGPGTNDCKFLYVLSNFHLRKT